MASNIGTGPQDIPINAYLGQQAFLDQPPERPALLAHHIVNTTNKGGQTNTHGNSVEIAIFGDVRFDNYGAYDTSTGRYTVPQRGLYCMTVSANLGFTSQGPWVSAWGYLNGTSYQRAYLNQEIQNGGWVYKTIQMFFPCEKGDIIDLRGQTNGSGAEFWYDDDGKYTAFAIHMVT
tara:strand:+ start:3995 stop:4522 length:528 start_codon:yes stop_codon:yes gene_type:complete